jgi:hypothetical protein
MKLQSRIAKLEQANGEDAPVCPCSQEISAVLTSIYGQTNEAFIVRHSPADCARLHEQIEAVYGAEN